MHIQGQRIAQVVEHMSNLQEVLILIPRTISFLCNARVGLVTPKHYRIEHLTDNPYEPLNLALPKGAFNLSVLL